MDKLGKKESTRIDLYHKLIVAKILIENNVTEDISIPNLAREATLSAFHFSRCFKAVFGLSPYQYYLQQKITKSHELLLTSNLDISAIAHELGFSELSAFSRMFKKVYGVAPLLYKKTVLRAQRTAVEAECPSHAA